MKDYSAMTVEELEQRLREAFFYTDKIDGTVWLELERLRAALEEKQPVEFEQTPEESWERFSQVYAKELEACCAGAAGTGGTGKRRPYGAILRGALIAAAVLVLLSGLALAADGLGGGLLAWVPGWNEALGRYEPVAAEAGKPIPLALAELGITEPVYPAYLPEGFVITESHISEEPLILVEQYARGNERLSITVTPISGFRTAVYQKGDGLVREYGSDAAVYYLFRGEGAITAIRYTESYAVTVSGDLPLGEMKGIIVSLCEVTA